jgi:hypothetical protein
MLEPRTTARRVTAAAGQIPVWTMPTPSERGALSEGHQPAHRRPAVPTRVHQSGGQPTRPDPARGHSGRPPPHRRQQPAPRCQDRTSSLRCGRSVLTPGPCRLLAGSYRRARNTLAANSKPHLTKPFHISPGRGSSPAQARLEAGCHTLPTSESRASAVPGFDQPPSGESAPGGTRAVGRTEAHPRCRSS